jgi:hypothetical protein
MNLSKKRQFNAGLARGRRRPISISIVAVLENGTAFRHDRHKIQNLERCHCRARRIAAPDAK